MKVLIASLQRVVELGYQHGEEVVGQTRAHLPANPTSSQSMNNPDARNGPEVLQRGCQAPITALSRESDTGIRRDTS